ncbi:MAG: MerR family transcriptional regulator, partial [Planctomycetes bacterium]|nr:MerR family transcriptional regulator [Planctomycetota bacterium]
MSQDGPETYSIAQAGETLGVSVADIEAYLEEGLVTARAGAGGAATFTRVEMRRLWSIVTLHRDLGINLPGVAAVLQLREQYEQERRDLATLVEIVERELGPDVWD